MQRQSLACTPGGQLSQFAWFVHYDDADGSHRAGTLNDGEPESENLRVVEPVRAVSDQEAMGEVETSDGKLRVRVRALLGAGNEVAVEFVLSNRHAAALRNLRLSAYANIEAAHTHAGDYSVLDARTSGLLVLDPPTGMTVLMAGLNPPASGYTGTWNSMSKAQAAEGVARAQWKPFTGLPPTVHNLLLGERMAAAGIYLPYTFENPTTPETRRLTETEAADALRRDWLFQAAGQPLLQRARDEVGWARALAARLGQAVGSEELKKLAELEQLLLDVAAANRSADAQNFTSPCAGSNGAS